MLQPAGTVWCCCTWRREALRLEHILLLCCWSEQCHHHQQLAGLWHCWHLHLSYQAGDAGLLVLLLCCSPGASCTACVGPSQCFCGMTCRQQCCSPCCRRRRCCLLRLLPQLC
jgi:hypothetical protein